MTLTTIKTDPNPHMRHICLSLENAGELQWVGNSWVWGGFLPSVYKKENRNCFQ